MATTPSRTALVVPTRGDRPAALRALVRRAIEEEITPFIVWTGDGRPPHWLSEASVTKDWRTAERALNIHRWWNAGIEAAYHDGNNVVIVCNDDVQAAPGALTALAAPFMRDEDAAHLTYVTPPWAARITPITGYAFALSTRWMWLPDESYQWWYGEHDLELRVRADGGIVEPVECDIRHLRRLDDWSYPSDVSARVREATRMDKILFDRRWPEARIREVMGR